MIMGGALALLVVGAVLYPRPSSNVSAREIVAQAVKANAGSTGDSLRRIEDDMREGCIPTLEGSDVISGRHAWAVRLKIAPPRHPNERHKRYPWLEVWVDKKTGVVLAWKEWGRREGRIVVLAQSPKP